ncbi:hypothetical protein U724_00095 [Pseudomonas chlororaphis subsp. aurantiaca PB-St2]|nr:hypothetical protein U724_00095 [Pseudomonas chlororaphis subsp. aurantiaca PB-St2]
MGEKFGDFFRTIELGAHLEQSTITPKVTLGIMDYLIAPDTIKVVTFHLLKAIGKHRTVVERSRPLWRTSHISNAVVFQCFNFFPALLYKITVLLLTNPSRNRKRQVA